MRRGTQAWLHLYGRPDPSLDSTSKKVGLYRRRRCGIGSGRRREKGGRGRKEGSSRATRNSSIAIFRRGRARGIRVRLVVVLPFPDRK